MNAVEIILLIVNNNKQIINLKSNGTLYNNNINPNVYISKLVRICLYMLFILKF